MGINNVDLKPPISFGEQVKSSQNMRTRDVMELKFSNIDWENNITQL